MAQNYSQLIFLVPWFILVIIAFSMFVQGWMIMNARHGYTKNPKLKHPEMNDIGNNDPLLIVKFSEQDIRKLHENEDYFQ
jgi:hypothetical protein